MFKMNVSVLGLGIIGSAWAKNLIADGHTVRCWNRTPKDFPNFYASILEAVNKAEVIIHHRYDPPAVQSVLNQIQSKLGPGQLVIQSSTISAKWTRLFAEEVRKTGASFLEASFTGSKIAAEQRQTVYYLGGDPEIVEKARPILKPLSKAILHIGPLGSASSLKLAMNLNIAGVAQTLCESLILCRRLGSRTTFISARWRTTFRIPVSLISKKSNFGSEITARSFPSRTWRRISAWHWKPPRNFRCHSHRQDTSRASTIRE
jgi:3-hydroxyisobutyrate dehydrogenase-like beta-hydroxyacid dehydrogenase